jgi:hypothetical protein
MSKATLAVMTECITRKKLLKYLESELWRLKRSKITYNIVKIAVFASSGDSTTRFPMVAIAVIEVTVRTSVTVSQMRIS